MMMMMMMMMMMIIWRAFNAAGTSAAKEPSGLSRQDGNDQMG